MNASELSARYRTAFVTGASTGLGLAFTRMLLDHGVETWGTARDAARLPKHERFHPVTLELADGPGAEAGFKAAEAAAGGFDLVINNAGFGVFGAYAQTEFKVWEEQFRVMLVNTARLCHAALPGMLARHRGAVVNISSIAGEFGMPYQAVYNAIKAGLSALTESLMYEVKGTGVIVIDFRPGDYRTDFEGSVRRPSPATPLAAGDIPAARMDRAWQAFTAMMQSGPRPERAAADLKRALLRGRSATVRSGRFFQAVLGPFLARFGSLPLRRKVQEWYFGLQA